MVSTYERKGAAEGREDDGKGAAGAGSREERSLSPAKDGPLLPLRPALPNPHLPPARLEAAQAASMATLRAAQTARMAKPAGRCVCSRQQQAWIREAARRAAPRGLSATDGRARDVETASKERVARQWGPRRAHERVPLRPPLSPSPLSPCRRTAVVVKANKVGQAAAAAVVATSMIAGVSARRRGEGQISGCSRGTRAAALLMIAPRSPASGRLIRPGARPAISGEGHAPLDAAG